MNTIIWMEMLLIGASILIFRSVWTFLDSIAWASGGVGLAVLLVVGVVAAVVALRSIEALSEIKGKEAGDERASKPATRVDSVKAVTNRL